MSGPIQIMVMHPDSKSARRQRLELRAVRDRYGDELAGELAHRLLGGEVYAATLPDGSGLLASCPTERLAVLASQCVDDWSRMEVSGRLRLAQRAQEDALLLALAGDRRSSRVRRAIAANPHTPPDALMVLATDSDVDVAVAVAQRADLIDPVCELLLGAPAVVRLELAANPHCLPSVLERLAEDAELPVALEALEHPNLPPLVAERILQDLASDPRIRVRRAAVGCARVPTSVLRCLAQDSDPMIQATARERLNARGDLAAAA